MTNSECFSFPTHSPILGLAEFPFNASSLHTLWKSSYQSPHNCDPALKDLVDLTNWTTMLAKYSDAFAAASDGDLFLWSSSLHRKVRLPQQKWEDWNYVPSDITHVAWALRPSEPCCPLILCSHMSTVYVWDCERHQIIGRLQGHGGAITSLAVHPVFPHIFSTTSRDFSVRLYDLRFEVDDTLINPPWPPSQLPSQHGAPFGLRMPGEEGAGFGRCICILAGGRSGGSKAAVLGADFHPTLPLIATCGMDRACKIWPLPFLVKYDETKLLRLDKPLFSSSVIHQARVIFIKWLRNDLLLSASASTFHYTAKEEVLDDLESLPLVEGAISIWRWLSLARYFPNGPESCAHVGHEQFQGHSTDFQESGSLKMIGQSQIPTGSMLNIPRIWLHQRQDGSAFGLFMLHGESSVHLFEPADITEWNRKSLPLKLTPVGGIGDRKVYEGIISKSGDSMIISVGNGWVVKQPITSRDSNSCSNSSSATNP